MSALRSTVTALAGAFDNPAAYRAHLLSGVWRLGHLPEDHAALYDLLRAYYSGVGVYDDVRAILQRDAQAAPALLALRNPANAAVEFYAATIWAGNLGDALEIESDNEAIIAPIEQVWSWSNWAAQRQVFARGLAMLGDQFVKVATRRDEAGRPTRVYFQLLDPATVTVFDTDERGYLTYLRLDVNQWRNQGGLPQRVVHTEVWDKSLGLYRAWEHGQSARTTLPDLGPPQLEVDFRAEWGIDFLPFVHAKFRDVGEPRGVGCFTNALEAIDEANRLATRLHQLLARYGRGDWVLYSGGRDSEGRSIPPPPFAGDAAQVEVGDEQFYSLPAGWDLKSLVAPINYADALKVLEAQLSAIEHFHLPELRYYRISELSSDTSGRAIRFLLAGAIDRVIEARGNAEHALVRLDQMALTLGINAGLFPRDLGTFERGDFDHDFAERDVIPLSALEEAQADQARAQAAYSKTQAGWSVQQAMREAGVSEEEIAQSLSERDAGNASLGSALLRQFNAGQGSGMTGG